MFHSTRTRVSVKIFALQAAQDRNHLHLCTCLFIMTWLSPSTQQGKIDHCENNYVESIRMRCASHLCCTDIIDRVAHGTAKVKNKSNVDA